MRDEVNGSKKTSRKKVVILLKKEILSFLLPEKNGCASSNAELALEGMALRFYHDLWRCHR